MAPSAGIPGSTYVFRGDEIVLSRAEDANRGFVRGVDQQTKDHRVALALRCDNYLRC